MNTHVYVCVCLCTRVCVGGVCVLERFFVLLSFTNLNTKFQQIPKALRAGTRVIAQIEHIHDFCLSILINAIQYKAKHKTSNTLFILSLFYSQ